MPKGFSPYACVYTRANTSDGGRRFFPLTGTREAAPIKLVLRQFEIWAMTGDTKVEPALQVADTEEGWPDAATYTRIGSLTGTADGFYVSSGFDDISASLVKAYVRFGVIVRNNTSGSPKTELCWVRGRFDVRSC